MSTDAQIKANQANARKSCGPKTEAGKAISCRNRLTYGFASSTRFIQDENPAEFASLLDDLKDEHQPATITEHILVEKMAHNQWIGLRAMRVEGNLMILGSVEALPILRRYQTVADGAFHKAHAELVKAKKQRGNTPIGFEWKTAADPVAAPPQPAPEPRPQQPSAPVPPPQSPKVPKTANPTSPVEPAAPDFFTMEQELEWLMTIAHQETLAASL